MKFVEALTALDQGKKVRRKSWNTAQAYIRMSRMIVDEDNDNIDLNSLDIMATDWEEVDE